MTEMFVYKYRHIEKWVDFSLINTPYWIMDNLVGPSLFSLVWIGKQGFQNMQIMFNKFKGLSKVSVLFGCMLGYRRTAKQI